MTNLKQVDQKHFSIVTLVKSGLEKSGVAEILNGMWARDLFYWFLDWAGLVSSLIFLFATIWMCVSSAVPDFIRDYFRLDTAKLFTYLSKTAFTGLPEIVLFLALGQTIEHLITLCSSKKMTWQARLMAAFWFVSFGIPCWNFINYALANLSLAVANHHYIMPEDVLIARCKLCFAYSLIMFVYEGKGKAFFAKMLAQKESKIAEMEQALTDKDQEMVTALAEKNKEMVTALAEKDRMLLEQKQEASLRIEESKLEKDQLLLQLSQEQNEKLRIAEKASSLASNKLSFYPKLQAFLESTGTKTINIDKLCELTGHPKRRINKAISEKALSLQSRNKEILISSLLKWLQEVPVPNVVIMEESNGNGNGHTHNTDEIEAFSFPLLTIGNDN